MNAPTPAWPASAVGESLVQALIVSLHGQPTLAAFGQTLLGHLAHRLDAFAGALHVREAADGPYRLAAQHAGNASPAFAEQYAAGEGVAGQAAAERRLRVCRGQAADWMWISGATVASAAVSVVIAPLVLADATTAVIELALMRDVDDAALATLEATLPVVALLLDGLQARLATEAAFSRSQVIEARQRQILAHVYDGIFGQDAEGRVSFVNAAALDILGFTEDEVLGQPMHALTHHHYPDGRPFPREECPIWQCGRDGQTRTVADQVFWRRDRTPVPVEYTVAAMHEGGRPAGVVISFRDISSHLQAEAALRSRDEALARSELRLRTLFETANEGIWIIDAEGRTTELNAAMAAILGRPREAVLGRTIFEFVNAANADVFRRQMAERQLGRTGAYDISLSQPDGRQVPCLFNATPTFDVDGRRTGSFAMVADLTRFRRSDH